MGEMGSGFYLGGGLCLVIPPLLDLSLIHI